MALVNLTQHEVVVYNDDEVVYRIPPSIEGGLKVAQEDEFKFFIRRWLPVVKSTWGELTPNPHTISCVEEGDSVIVSTITSQCPEFQKWAKEMKLKVYVPNTGPSPHWGGVRDNSGHIIGVRSLKQVFF